jgi:hypothetical protein
MASVATALSLSFCEALTVERRIVMNDLRISLITCCLGLLLTASICCVYLAVPGAASGPAIGGTTITTVAADLHNPRGLNFAPDGSLYVAEAGGEGTATTMCGVMGDMSTKCYAETGSITRIDLAKEEVTRVLTELPSLIAPNGTAAGATGVHDVSFQGLGNTYVTMGFGGNPELRSTYFGDAGDSFARLGRFNPSGKFRLYENLGDYEITANPHPVAIDSNPYGILALPGKVVYADAGGNFLAQVTAKGVISTLAVFPNRVITRPNGTMVSVQAVPTSVAVGPDGDYYVGQLTGGPFTVGVAIVWRVPADGGTPVEAYTGFTNIIDIAFGPDGSLYVLEIARDAIPNFNPGRLVRVEPDGTRTEIAAGLLTAPGGIAIGSDGALYVTNRSTSATLGAVLRIEP